MGHGAVEKDGFNMIRKHIKVEPEQYYYYADSLGLMMWQDMVSGFATSRKKEEHVNRWLLLIGTPPKNTPANGKKKCSR